MHEMTRQDLLAAFAGESQAHMRYLAFSRKADKEGKPEIARMFKAITYAEQVHAHNHLKALGGVGDTVKNLETAAAGENFEITEMYPAYDAVAKLQDEKDALRSIHYALEAEKIHYRMYIDAGKDAAQGADHRLKEIYVCPVCGYTHEGECADFCPVCGAKKSVFEKF